MSINQILQPSETCNDEKKLIAKGTIKKKATSIKTLFDIFCLRVSKQTKKMILLLI